MLWTKCLNQTNEILTKNVKHGTIKENKSQINEEKQLRGKASHFFPVQIDDPVWTIFLQMSSVSMA